MNAPRSLTEGSISGGMIRFSLPILFIVSLSLGGCKAPGGTTPKSGRQLSTSADALAFGEEFGNAVYIGTQPANDLTATNVGTRGRSAGTRGRSDAAGCHDLDVRCAAPKFLANCAADAVRAVNHDG